MCVCVCVCPKSVFDSARELICDVQGECDALLSTDLCSCCPGKTALHYAVETGHAEMVQCLLEAGADVHRRTREVRRPF